MEDEDRDAISPYSTTPPGRRHGTTTAPTPTTPPTTNATPLSNSGSKRSNQFRNHSLDDVRITNHHQHRHLGGPFYNNDSDDEGEFFPYSTNAAGQNIRYDHSVSLPVIMSTGGEEEDDQRLAMQEFTASGGVGIFKAPTRAAVHPTRPPALELRPHPLRETQVGRFLRTMACTETQLWAGQENGVRFWKYEDAYEAGVGFGGKGKRGDEDTAPFCESAVTSPTLCMVVDNGNRLVWTGHKDGKIRSWKMDQDGRGEEEGPATFREGLACQAHKGPVLALIISSYGKTIRDLVFSFGLYIQLK